MLSPVKGAVGMGLRAEISPKHHAIAPQLACWLTKLAHIGPAMTPVAKKKLASPYACPNDPFVPKVLSQRLALPHYYRRADCLAKSNTRER